MSGQRFTFIFSSIKPLRQIQFPLQILFYLLTVFGLPLSADAQRIAVLAPDKTVRSRIFAAELEKALSSNYKVLDASLSEAAFLSQSHENHFNLSTPEAKNAGAAIGCHYYLLVKNELLRRSAFQREEYYESYAVIYAVSSRTGKLVFWKIKSFEAEQPSGAEKKSFDSISSLANEIFDSLKTADNKELEANDRPNIEEFPAANAPEAKNLRPPLPYRRIKPAYTDTADFYNVEATVDILVDVGESGEILRTEITRWAGYGLDEAVTEAVRKMIWRPADRNGKPLPMRILLRYNFKDIQDEPDP